MYSGIATYRSGITTIGITNKAIDVVCRAVRGRGITMVTTGNRIGVKAELWSILGTHSVAAIGYYVTPKK